MKHQKGLTFVELVIASVIISIVSVGLFQSLGLITQNSVDPLIRQKALSVAEAYIEEIATKAFFDPTTLTVCPAAPASRADYNNVCDYKGIAADNVVKDQFGAVVVGFDDYSVFVVIDEAASVTLNGLAGPLVISIQVTVLGPRGQSLMLTAYRTAYG